MSEPGLNQRLRQRSRRAGLMIGITMALAIAICVAGFSVIYTMLDDVAGDFVTRSAPTSEPPPEESDDEVLAALPDDEDGEDETDEQDESSEEESQDQDEEQSEEEAQDQDEGQQEPAQGGDNQSNTDADDEPEPTDEADDENGDADENDDFEPDFQIDSTQQINLREGPGVEYAVVVVLPLEEPIQYLDDAEVSANPAADGLGEGQEWLLFRTQDGEEGWVREIDVADFEP